MVIVPTLSTPLPLEAFPTLIEGAFGALGARITRAQVLNFAALAALETARGKSVKNGNIGNLTAGESYEGPAWRPPWFELDPGALARGEIPARTVQLHQAMLEGRAPRAFRAYGSVQDGARDFARLLLTKPYAPLFEAAKGSDVDQFRRALSERYSPDYSNPKATESLQKLVSELGGAPTGNGGTLLVLAGLGWLLYRWLR